MITKPTIDDMKRSIKALKRIEKREKIADKKIAMNEIALDRNVFNAITGIDIALVWKRFVTLRFPFYVGIVTKCDKQMYKKTELLVDYRIESQYTQLSSIPFRCENQCAKPGNNISIIGHSMENVCALLMLGT